MEKAVEAVVKIICVSASGALAPGPLMAASASLGARRGWRAGASLAFGHTVVELPLVLLIAYGLEPLLSDSRVKVALGVVGGVFLIFFGFLTAKEALKAKGFGSREDKRPMGSAVFAGVMLTALNPYFLSWWAGVGAPLLAETVNPLTPLNLALFYLAHVWLDYAALTAASALSSFSKVNLVFYRVLLAALAATVFYFGAEMLARSLLSF